MAYSPNPYDSTNPTDSVFAETAQAEFRAIKGLLITLQKDFITGLTLSNDATTPNSVLDISAGGCTDTTNLFYMVNAAFTKTTVGFWAVGTGAAGMGNGLVIANNTWYHVFSIINSGVNDYYFDTSLTAANKPIGTTAFRRIGSFKTNGAAQILAFTQVGGYFRWAAAVHDINALAINAAVTALTLNATPPGVTVDATFRASLVNSALPVSIIFGSLFETLSAPSSTNASLATSDLTVGISGQFEVLTSTVQTIRALCSNPVSNQLDVWTVGYFDFRGNFN